jgi:hypothetical protein
MKASRLKRGELYNHAMWRAGLRRERTIFSSLLLLVAGLALLLCLIAGAWVVRYRDAADYPGATFMGANMLYKFSPHVVIRRDTSYQTSAPFSDIYHFYSAGFDLGPEQHAQGACILMANATTTAWVIETEMAVTLCDTPEGRMIFVMRTVSLRWR